jgi:hypothetical protein
MGIHIHVLSKNVPHETLDEECHVYHFISLWERINKGVIEIVIEAHLFPKCEDDPQS